MRTYRDVLAVPEFAALTAVVCGNTAAAALARLTLATLVLDRTGSALLAALTMFGPSFAQVLGATLLLSAGDRLPPRAATAGLSLLFAAAAALPALPGAGAGTALAVVFGAGLANSVGGAVRWGLVGEILPPGGYLRGRAVLNIASAVLQIAGNGLGVVLLRSGPPRTPLLAAAGLYLAAALVARVGLRRRPPRAAGRPSVRETWRVNRRLFADRRVRRVYLALWVPNGLVVGAEALFVPYAGPAAGTLFTAAALGMLAGDAAVGRFVPARWRGRLTAGLPVVLAAPYLLFPLGPGVPLAAVLAGISSTGFAVSLLLQERLLALTPPEVHGQALGLHTSGMLTLQALAATAAGALAGRLPVGTAMAVMAGASLVVTLLAARGPREPSPRAVPEPA